MHQSLYLIFAGFIVVLDQLSKWAVTEHMIRPMVQPEEATLDLINWLTAVTEKLGFAEIYVLPVFNIVMVWNKGASFGMLSDYNSAILIGLSFVITIWFAIWLFMKPSPVQSMAIAMVIGGALGNVIDRIRFGAVIDFLDFHIFGYHWPAFNVADSCIVAGVFVLIIYSLFFEKNLHHQGSYR